MRSHLGRIAVLIALALAGCASAPPPSDTETYDLVIRGGTVYDGSGGAPIRADVAFPINRRTGDAAFQLYLSIGQSF